MITALILFISCLLLKHSITQMISRGSMLYSGQYSELLACVAMFALCVVFTATAGKGVSALLVLVFFACFSLTIL